MSSLHTAQAALCSRRPSLLRRFCRDSAISPVSPLGGKCQYGSYKPVIPRAAPAARSGPATMPARNALNARFEQKAAMA
eukprot:Nk52_evm1s1158 gene=Nk52_evmTU1s1158